MTDWTTSGRLVAAQRIADPLVPGRLVGEDVRTGGGAIRSMSAPGLALLGGIRFLF